MVKGFGLFGYLPNKKFSFQKFVGLLVLGLHHETVMFDRNIQS